MLVEDVVSRLRQLASLKTGDPLPDWLSSHDWGTPISKLAGQAADLIESLNRVARQARATPGFAEITKDMPRRSTEPAEKS